MSCISSQSPKVWFQLRVTHKKVVLVLVSHIGNNSSHNTDLSIIYTPSFILVSLPASEFGKTLSNSQMIQCVIQLELGRITAKVSHRLPEIHTATPLPSSSQPPSPWYNTIIFKSLYIVSHSSPAYELKRFRTHTQSRTILSCLTQWIWKVEERFSQASIQKKVKFVWRT